MKLLGCFSKSDPVKELAKNERRLKEQAMRDQMKARSVGAQAKEARKRLNDAASRNDVEGAKQAAQEAVILERNEKHMKSAAATLKENALGLQVQGTHLEHLQVLKKVNHSLRNSKLQGALAEKIITENKLLNQESKVTTANLQAQMFEDDIDDDVERQVQQAMHNQKMRMAEEARLQQQQLEEMMGTAPAAAPVERALNPV